VQPDAAGAAINLGATFLRFPVSQARALTTVASSAADADVGRAGAWAQPWRPRPPHAFPPTPVLPSWRMPAPVPNLARGARRGRARWGGTPVVPARARFGAEACPPVPCAARGARASRARWGGTPVVRGGGVRGGAERPWCPPVPGSWLARARPCRVRPVVPGWCVPAGAERPYCPPVACPRGRPGGAACGVPSTPPPNNGMHATPLRVPNLGATFQRRRVPSVVLLPTGGARNANR